LAPPFKKTEINLIYGKGYDTYWEILKLGIDLGIIDKVGAWYSYDDNKNFAQGEPGAALALKAEDNAKMYNEIRARVIDMLGLTEIYEQNS
jgi:recombination protein RecA